MRHLKIVPENKFWNYFIFVTLNGELVTPKVAHLVY
jgi:hypothetical protein